MKKTLFLLLAAVVLFTVVSCQSTEPEPVQTVSNKISYNLDGGELPAGRRNPDSYIVGDKVTLVNPEKKGYVFKGWTSEIIAKPQLAVSLTMTSARDLKFTANWELVEYKISYNLNGGHLIGNAQNMTSYHTGDTITLVNPVRDGYDFAGWKYEGISEPVLNLSGKINGYSDIVFVALWKPVVYTITYDLDGGECLYDVVNPSTYTIEDTVVFYPPTKVKSEFLGWIKSGEGILHKDFVIPAGSTGNIKLYAIYDRQRVEIGDTKKAQMNVIEKGKNGIIRPDWVICTEDTDSVHYEKAYAKTGNFIDSIEAARKICMYQFAEWKGVEVDMYRNKFDTDGVKDNVLDVYKNAAQDAYVTREGTETVGTVSADGSTINYDAVKNLNYIHEKGDVFTFMDEYIASNYDSARYLVTSFVEQAKVVEYWEDADGGVWLLMSIEK